MISVFVSVGSLPDVLEELFEESLRLRTMWDPETVSLTIFPSDDSTAWEGRLYYVSKDDKQ